MIFSDSLEKFCHARYPSLTITSHADTDLSASKILKLLRKRLKQQKKMRVSALSSSIRSWKVRQGRPSTQSSSKTFLPPLILSKEYLAYLLPLAQLPRTFTNRLIRVTSTSFASATATQKTESTVQGVLRKPLKRCMESFCLVLKSPFMFLPVWKKLKELRRSNTKQPSSRLPKRGATCSWKTSLTIRLKITSDNSLNPSAKLSLWKFSIQRSREKNWKKVCPFVPTAMHLFVSQHQTVRVWLSKLIFNCTEDLSTLTIMRLSSNARSRTSS